MKITVTGTAGCSDRFASDSLLVNIKPVPVVYAGPDLQSSPGIPVSINATVSGGSGAFGYQWTPEQLFVDSQIEDPITKPLTGNVTLVLSVVDLVSGCSGADSVYVDVSGGSQLPPVAVDDHDSTTVNVPVLISPLINDYDPAGSQLVYTILEGPYRGYVTPVTDSIFSYTPNQDFEGIDSIRYYIYDSDPVPQRDTAMIYIYVGEGIPVVIHNVITPNGDGMNDKWIITGIEEYPQNSVTIFNRWGDKIRSFDGYNNSSVVWDGTNKHGEPVPDGTYFYILKIDYLQDFQGWIFVRANSK